MALPTVQDVRDELEGYCITSAIVSDAFIQKKMDRIVIPYVQNKARTHLTAPQQITETYSGNGQGLLILNRRNITSIDGIQLVAGNDVSGVVNLASVFLIEREGILKIRSGLSEYFEYRTFPRGVDNIRVTYTYGGSCPDDIFEAIVMLTAVHVLKQLEGRSGGGQVSGQSYGRQYGNMGKYTNIRKELSRDAGAILARYTSAVVGA